MGRTGLILLVAATLAPPLARAADPSGPPPFDPEMVALAGRVEDPALATRAYLEAVPLERRAKTKAYATGNYFLDGADAAFSLLVFALLLGSGASARLRDRAERWTPSPSLRTAAYFVPFLAITTLVGFPLTLYRSYFREKAYGLLTQGFPDWLLDQAKVFALNAVFGALVLMALYAVLRRAPRTWWIWGSAVLVGFMAVFAALGAGRHTGP